MTGQEHYAKAEQLLDRASELIESTTEPLDATDMPSGVAQALPVLQSHILGLLSTANTHATLALAAAQGGYQSSSRRNIGYLK